MDPNAQINPDPIQRVLDPELQREVDRARRDIKLIGYVSIGFIGVMIIFTIVAALLTYGG